MLEYRKAIWKLLQGYRDNSGKKWKGDLLMIIVKSYKSNARHLAGKTTAVKWEDCRKQLKLYFPDTNRIRGEILAGEIIETPYMFLQGDRRKKDILVMEERRIRPIK